MLRPTSIPIDPTPLGGQQTSLDVFQSGSDEGQCTEHMMQDDGAKVAPHRTKTVETKAEDDAPTPRDLDVLFGRGKGHYDHPGNERFRSLVELQSHAFSLARSEQEKTELCRYVIAQIKSRSDPPARFLKKRDNDCKRKAQTEWHIVDDAMVLEKTKASFRYATQRHRSPPSAGSDGSCNVVRHSKSFVPTTTIQDSAARAKQKDMTKRKGEVVMEPTANDVLCSKGRGVENHPGNVRFRRLVSDSCVEYTQCSDKNTKRRICEKVVASILHADPEGRFLEQDKESAVWHQLDHKETEKKTKQALRDRARSTMSVSKKKVTRDDPPEAEGARKKQRTPSPQFALRSRVTSSNESLSGPSDSSSSSVSSGPNQAEESILDVELGHDDFKVDKPPQDYLSSTLDQRRISLDSDVAPGRQRSADEPPLAPTDDISLDLEPEYVELLQVSLQSFEDEVLNLHPEENCKSDSVISILDYMDCDEIQDTPTTAPPSDVEKTSTIIEVTDADAIDDDFDISLCSLSDFMMSDDLDLDLPSELFVEQEMDSIPSTSESVGTKKFGFCSMLVCALVSVTFFGGSPYQSPVAGPFGTHVNSSEIAMEMVSSRLQDRNVLGSVGTVYPVDLGGEMSRRRLQLDEPDNDEEVQATTKGVELFPTFTPSADHQIEECAVDFDVSPQPHMCSYKQPLEGVGMSGGNETRTDLNATKQSNSILQGAHLDHIDLNRLTNFNRPLPLMTNHSIQVR